MKPHSAVRTGLGAGSVYRAHSGFVPSTQDLLCSDVFSGRTDLQANAINDKVFFGTETGTASMNAGLGLKLLAGIIGAQNKAELTASLQRGEKWSANTGPLEIYGINALGVMRFSATSNECFNNIRAALGARKSMKVMLVPQALRTREISYDVSKSSGASLALPLTINGAAEANPSFSFSKAGTSTLQLKSKEDLNVCWAKPAQFELRRDSAVGPRTFRLDPV